MDPVERRRRQLEVDEAVRRAEGLAGHPLDDERNAPPQEPAGSPEALEIQSELAAAEAELQEESAPIRAKRPERRKKAKRRTRATARRGSGPSLFGWVVVALAIVGGIAVTAWVAASGTAPSSQVSPERMEQEATRIAKENYNRHLQGGFPPSDAVYAEMLERARKRVSNLADFTRRCGECISELRDELGFSMDVYQKSLDRMTQKHQETAELTTDFRRSFLKALCREEVEIAMELERVGNR